MARLTKPEVISVRLSSEERDAVDRAAEEAKVSRNQWLRRVVLAAIGRKP